MEAPDRSGEVIVVEQVPDRRRAAVVARRRRAGIDGCPPGGEHLRHGGGALKSESRSQLDRGIGRRLSGPTPLAGLSGAAILDVGAIQPRRRKAVPSRIRLSRAPAREAREAQGHGSCVSINDSYLAEASGRGRTVRAGEERSVDLAVLFGAPFRKEQGANRRALLLYQQGPPLDGTSAAWSAEPPQSPEPESERISRRPEGTNDAGRGSAENSQGDATDGTPVPQRAVRPRKPALARVEEPPREPVYQT